MPGHTKFGASDVRTHKVRCVRCQDTKFGASDVRTQRSVHQMSGLIKFGASDVRTYKSKVCSFGTSFCSNSRYRHAAYRGLQMYVGVDGP